MVDLGADDAKNKIRSECITARGERIFYLADAFRLGMSLDEVFDLQALMAQNISGQKYHNR
jgi:carbamoyl-phosphate synthase large subunit